MTSSLLGLAAVWLMVVISPGPCFVCVVQAVTRGGRRNGVSCALGIACGTLIWCWGSALGLALLLSTWSWVSVAIRLAGAAYLAWLGLKTLAGSLTTSRPEASDGADRNPHSSAGVPSRWMALRRGFVVDLSNPKAAAFFTSLLATFVPPGTSLSVWAFAIVEVIAIELAWYLLVAMLFSLPQVVDAYRRARRSIDFVVGTVYLGLSGKLALSR